MFVVLLLESWMMSTPQNLQMVMEVNYRHRSWWMDIKRDWEREIRQLLGGRTIVIFVILNAHLTRPC